MTTQTQRQRCPTVASADVAAAAPPWVRDLLAEWAGQATVLHSGPDAVYLQLGQDVLAVLSRHAIHVPCGLRTTLETTDHLTPELRHPAPGTQVPVDGQRLHFTGADVHIGRTVSHATPAVDPADTSDMAPRLRAALTPLSERIRGELPDSHLRALGSCDPHAPDGLLGRGSGLTPLGDDVLCGWLATMVAASHPGAQGVADQVLTLADQRTTALSATLLGRAVHGQVIPQFAHLINALTHGSGTPESAVQDLARVGHTSGLGMALGLSLALDHLASRSSCS